MEPHVVVILLGAGAGARLGSPEPKVFLPIGDRPMLALAAAAASSLSSVRGLVVAVPPGWEERAAACLGDVQTPTRFVTGNASRQGSVRIALGEVEAGTEIVIVHDAARPFASPDLFRRIAERIVAGADAVVPVLEVTDTVLRARERAVVGTARRDGLVLAQTPQAFRADVLRRAHARAETEHRAFTDDASLLAWAGGDVRTVPGDPGNVKITTSADLAQADRRMRSAGG